MMTKGLFPLGVLIFMDKRRIRIFCLFGTWMHTKYYNNKIFHQCL